MKINRHQIAAFTAVGREKSFQNAAKSLALGQSAISQHISGLESAIGARLFIRGRAGTELTGVGRKLFSVADRIRVLEELFLEQAQEYAELNAGSLSICVSTPRPAMAIIAEYRRRFPKINVDLVVAPWMEGLKMVHQRDVDVAIVIEPEDTNGLCLQEVERKPFVGVLPIEHALSSKNTINMDALKNETIVMLGETSYTHNWINKRFAEIGFIARSSLTITSYEMLIEAINHGLGVSVALEGAVASQIGICTLPITEFSEQHAYCVVCTDDNAQLRAVQHFFGVASEYQSGGAPSV